jgi:dipeptidyl aminopeptidase/acylaminoacyl peptidase
MLTDANSALNWTLSQSTIDRRRVAIWGTSIGASRAMVTAARRPEVGAVALNCPIIDTHNGATKLGCLRMTAAGHD